jgi:hypothetical protein
MKRSTLTIGFYLTLVFASGVAVGSFGQYLRDAKSVSAKTNNPQEDYKKKYLSEMGSRLKLSGAQRQALGNILDETRSKYHSIKAKYDPEMKMVRDEQRGKVKQMLDETQRAEYEKMLVEQAARDKANKQPGGPGGI